MKQTLLDSKSSINLTIADGVVRNCLRIENNGAFDEHTGSRLKSSAKELEATISDWYYGFAPSVKGREELAALVRDYKVEFLLGTWKNAERLRKSMNGTTIPVEDVTLFFPNEVRVLLNQQVERGSLKFAEAFEDLLAIRAELKPVQLTDDEIKDIVAECVEKKKERTFDNCGLTDFIFQQNGIF